MKAQPDMANRAERENREEMERHLRAVPVRNLPPGARERIESALSADGRSAEVMPSRTASQWWSRRVPLWQAAAACVAVFALARAIDRSPSVHPGRGRGGEATLTVAPAPSVTLVRIDPEQLGLPRRPDYHMDVTRWRVLDGS